MYISCTWPQCEKQFKNASDYNHHCKNHTRPFQCPSCPARHASKRHLDRHTNERHTCLEKYYCTVRGCNRSLREGGRPFPREDNCRRHMRNTHKMVGGEVGMDEGTRKLRGERKLSRRGSD